MRVLSVVERTRLTQPDGIVGELVGVRVGLVHFAEVGWLDGGLWLLTQGEMGRGE